MKAINHNWGWEIEIKCKSIDIKKQQVRREQTSINFGVDEINPLMTIGKLTCSAAVNVSMSIQKL
jgi:hypothetical protein